MLRKENQLFSNNAECHDSLSQAWRGRKTIDVKNVQKRIKNVKKRKKRNENKERL